MVQDCRVIYKRKLDRETLYHPPRPQYTSDSLLDYIEACIDELNGQYPAAPIVVAGDFNQLPDHAVTERTGLSQIVYQPTRGQNILDRVFVSCPVYRSPCELLHQSCAVIIRPL